MHPTPGLQIELVDRSEFDLFLAYLNDHLSDNGQGDTAYFHPVPRNEPHMQPDKAEAFRNGLQVRVGCPGWRRIWVARTPQRQIVGHVDLRSHPMRFAAHRCLLGMGVERTHRRSGIGEQLIAHAQQWAQASDLLEWIDLQVLSVNEPALRLYRRAGFEVTGETPEMFRIDGQTYSYVSMAKRVAPPHVAR